MEVACLNRYLVVIWYTTSRLCQVNDTLYKLFAHYI